MTFVEPPSSAAVHLGTLGIQPETSTGLLGQPLSWFTPVPPARNGIADYAGMLLTAIVKLNPCVCYCEDPLAELPEGVEARDPSQAFRHLTRRSPILHQIGNNCGHVFALDALRRFGGVTSLHDLSLLYVHELGAEDKAELFGRMQSPNKELGAVYANHWKHSGVKTAANYILFDLAGDILKQSRAVIVHSTFAKRKLVAVHGGDAQNKIHVIPHFAKAMTTSSEQARAELGLSPAPDETILLTSGFATKSKRFDWLIDALATLRARGKRFRWIHAGKEMADEFALSDAIEAHPSLAGCCAVTGYLTEDKLDCYIAAADIIINLRFPSVGESSGTLARAFAAGRCCIVNDTAAYAELPRDVVVHIPVFDTVGALVRALDHLMDDRSISQAFGARAKEYAYRHLSIESVARQYLDVIADGYSTNDPGLCEAFHQVPHKKTLPRLLEFDFDASGAASRIPDYIDPATGPFELTLWFETPEEFAEAALQQPALVSAVVGPHVKIEGVRFIGAADARSKRLGICVSGTAFG